MIDLTFVDQDLVGDVFFRFEPTQWRRLNVIDGKLTQHKYKYSIQTFRKFNLLSL